MKKIYTFFFTTLLVTSSFAQTPYAKYPLDGNANDISSNSQNGTMFGAPSATSNRYNQSGKALALNGTSKYVALPQSFDFPNLTVIGWFKATSTGGNNTTTVIYSSDNNSLQYGHQKFLLEDVSTFPQVRIQSGDVSFVNPTTLNEWHQLAFTRTPSQVKVFIDGVLEHTDNSPGNYHSASGVAFATIGAGYTLGNFLNGSVDDFLIYDVALADSQIVVNYNSIRAEREIEENITLYSISGNIFMQSSHTLNGEITTVEVRCYDGKLLSIKGLNDIAERLNAESLVSGLYLVSFRDKNGKILGTKKVNVL